MSLIVKWFSSFPHLRRRPTCFHGLIAAMPVPFSCHRICVSFACLFLLTLQMCVIGLGKRSRYSESLEGGRDEDRIPVGERISASVQTGPGTHPASCAMGTGSLSRGWSGRSMASTSPAPI